MECTCAICQPYLFWLKSYCKRGYFRWGKISRKCWQDVSRGGNFHDSTHISFIKTYGFYFRVGVIFTKKTKSLNTRKLPPRENFHVYSIVNINVFQKKVILQGQDHKVENGTT